MLSPSEGCTLPAVILVLVLVSAIYSIPVPTTMHPFLSAFLLTLLTTAVSIPAPVNPALLAQPPPTTNLPLHLRNVSHSTCCVTPGLTFDPCTTEVPCAYGRYCVTSDSLHPCPYGVVCICYPNQIILCSDPAQCPLGETCAYRPHDHHPFCVSISVVDVDPSYLIFSGGCVPCSTSYPPTHQPTTHKTTTYPPTTHKTTTHQTTTHKTTTYQPTTHKTTTYQPTTQKTTTFQTTTQKTTTHQTTTHKTTTYPPTTHKTTTYQPTTHKTTTYHPTTHKTTAYPPTTHKTTTHQTTTQKTTTYQPTTHKPTTHRPTTHRPTTHKPTAYPPTTQKPPAERPTTKPPTTAPPPSRTPHRPTISVVRPSPSPTPRPKTERATPSPRPKGCLAGDPCSATSPCCGYRKCMRRDTLKDCNGHSDCVCLGSRVCVCNDQCTDGEVCAGAPGKSYCFSPKLIEDLSWATTLPCVGPAISPEVGGGTRPPATTAPPRKIPGLTGEKCHGDTNCRAPRKCIAGGGESCLVGGILCDRERTPCQSTDSTCYCYTLNTCNCNNDCKETEICTATTQGRICVSRELLSQSELMQDIECHRTGENGEPVIIVNEPEPVPPVALTGTPRPSPSPVRAPGVTSEPLGQDANGGGGDVCIDVRALKDFDAHQLVFEKHPLAHVLCDANDSCATPGHIVVYRGSAMMMKSYCNSVGCVKKVTQVNSPRLRQRLRVSSESDGLEFTAFAARYGTKSEELLLAAAVRVGL